MTKITIHLFWIFFEYTKYQLVTDILNSLEIGIKVSFTMPDILGVTRTVVCRSIDAIVIGFSIRNDHILCLFLTFGFVSNLDFQISFDNRYSFSLINISDFV
jgi:hypothetical protein